jgi:hypothetical protein
MAAPELEPEEAAWMDDTTFGRWMLESFADPRTALARLRRDAAAGVAALVEEVLRRSRATERAPDR